MVQIKHFRPWILNMKSVVPLLVGFLVTDSSNGFGGHQFQPSVRRQSQLFAQTRPDMTRRNWIQSLVAFGLLVVSSDVVRAQDPVEMKLFVDPVGYFSISIPQNFFTLRRSAKGDLPDPKSGTGRRGSSIFTAGDLQKAEIVAVERFPTESLLEENGIEPIGDLSTFPGIGEPGAVANLLNMRRDREKGGTTSNTLIIPGSLYVSPDGKELTFKLKTEIDVQKPELLMEQYGASQLFRITLAKASLRSNDGNIMAVFASALEKDFEGPDGDALLEAVRSFAVADLYHSLETKATV